MPGARPPLRDQILSFLHTFLAKSTRVEGPRPPTGNPGPATTDIIWMPTGLKYLINFFHKINSAHSLIF